MMEAGTNAATQSSIAKDGGLLGKPNKSLDGDVPKGPLGQKLDEALNGKWIEQATGVKPDALKDVQTKIVSQEMTLNAQTFPSLQHKVHSPNK